MPGTYAIVAAAGRGSRFGGAIPKQYRGLAGRPVLRHAVEALLRGGDFVGVVVAIHPDDRGLYDSAVAGLDVLPQIEGGAERQETVLAALEKLATLEPDRVLVHDGARPLLDIAVTRRILSALDIAAMGRLRLCPSGTA